MKDKSLSKLKAFNNLRKNPVLGFVRKLLPQSLKNKISQMYGISTNGEASLKKISLSNGTAIYIPMDQYWALYMDDINKYEPEIKEVLDVFSNENTLFIDGGANIGLWSVYASGLIPSSSQIIAVEPTKTTLSILEKNKELNNNNFSIMPKGIWKNSDEILEFKLYHSHAANSIKENTQADGTEREIKDVLKIETITIDDIIQNAKKNSPNINNVILKLDVEGVEIEALEGMVTSLAEDNLIIMYEDHAKEIESEATKYILENLSMNVYYIDEKNLQSVKKIKDLDEVKDIKTTFGKGYNFMACVADTEFDLKMSNMCQ